MKAEYLIIRAVALFGAVMMTVSCGSRSDKPLLPNVSGIGRFVVKHYKVLAVVLVIMIFPAFYG